MIDDGASAQDHPGRPGLRARAEAALHGRSTRADATTPDLLHLLHELRVHEIELELQNDELQHARNAAEAALERYQQLYDGAPAALLSVNRQGLISEANPAAALLLDSAPGRAEGRNLAAFVHLAGLAILANFLELVFASRGSERIELRLASHAGHHRTVQLEAVRSRDGGSCLLLVSDVTERRQADARLQVTASAFAHIREGAMITMPDGTIAEVNAAFTRITGYERLAVLGRNPSMLGSGRHPPAFFTEMWQALIEVGHWSGDVWNRHSSGELYAGHLSISDVRSEDGRIEYLVGLLTDVTARKVERARLEHDALHDALTGMPNRVLLARRLADAIERSQARREMVMVACVDLDDFKAVNDRHGHAVGDEVLVVLARRMRDALRAQDTLARVGGDEFIVVLAGLATVAEGELVLNRLRAATHAPVDPDGLCLTLTVSIGVTCYPLDHAEAEQLIRHADQAMLLAKQHDRRYPQMFDVYAEAARRSTREQAHRLRTAMGQHELSLHFQPKIDLRTGALAGAEALLRWQHPTRGLLAAAQFLPTLQDHPLMVSLGSWVIDAALAQMQQWQVAGLRIAVSVNIAGRQLLEPDFIARLRAALQAHPDVAPELLELEVLDSSALTNPQRVADLLRTCGELGVRCALDDFGTGLSSLTYLKRLPASTIKIDRSLVAGMLNSTEDLAIVEAVIRLARASRRTVVAEGVESLQQGELLLALGCELAQGHLIAAAMPGDALTAWIGRWQLPPGWAAWNGDDAGQLEDGEASPPAAGSAPAIGPIWRIARLGRLREQLLEAIRKPPS